MPEMSEQEIADALDAMEIGDVIAFPNGAIAHRDNDGWGITIDGETVDEEPEEERPEVTAEELADQIASWSPEERLAIAREFLEGQGDQDFFSQLSAAADADEKPTRAGNPAERAFRDLLGGE